MENFSEKIAGSAGTENPAGTEKSQSAGARLREFWRRSREARTRVLRRLVQIYIAGTLAFFALFALVAYTPLGLALGELQIECTPFDELADDAEAVVILGGDPVRASDAVKVFYAGKARRIVVSSDEVRMLDVLLGARVPADKISVDPAPLRTIDHPRTIQACGITPDTKIIITSTCLQERRAAHLFRDAGYTNFQVYSQTHEIRFPWLRESGQMLGAKGAVDVFYAYLAWLKHALVDF